jgi:copper chaperone CopZ
MTCGHCVSAVTEEVQSISGVSEVTIDLVEGGDSSVIVTSEASLDVKAVRAAVDEAGYELID